MMNFYDFAVEHSLRTACFDYLETKKSIRHEIEASSVVLHSIEHGNFDLFNEMNIFSYLDT